MQQASLQSVLHSESIDTTRLASDDIFGAVRKVALFTEAFLPKVDGVSRTALLTLKYLEQTGREVIVFAPAPAPSRISQTPVYAIPSLWLPFYPETRVAPPWPFVMSRLRTFQPDLIHLFSPFSLGAIGMMAGGWLGVPVIGNYQTDLPAYTHSYGYGYLASTITGLLRYIHNGCTLTLAPSQSTRRELRSWGFRRLRLWQRGVDTDRFTPSRRKPVWRERLLAGRDPSRLVALYVGRMAKEKHLETLRDLAEEPGIALTLVGNGNHLSSVQQALAASDSHFTGYLVGDDLADAFAAADLFVFPGPEETFGQVVLEALASGLPAIVVERGGPATIVSDGCTGFVCPVDDSAAFAGRARLLRDHPDMLKQMSFSARHSAENRPWLAIMRQLEGYYGEAVCLHSRHKRLAQRVRIIS